MKTENLGRGNTTTILRGQISIETVRFWHNLRYGAPTRSMLSFTLGSLDSLDSFKRKLKFYLFNSCFNV